LIFKGSAGPVRSYRNAFARGDQGINPLDEPCEQHDISCSQSRDNLDARHAADRILAQKAWERVITKDASLGEKAAAWAVTNVIKAKTKLSMGLKKKMREKLASARKLKGKLKKIGHNPRKPAKKTALRKIVNAAKKATKKKQSDPFPAALEAARRAVLLAGGSGCINKPRILPVPKIDGALPALLIPIMAAPGAAGSVAGGPAGSKAVNDAKAVKRKRGQEGSEQHNKKMEAIAFGRGLYHKPYRKGLGLYLKPYPKNG